MGLAAPGVVKKPGFKMDLELHGIPVAGHWISGCAI